MRAVPISSDLAKRIVAHYEKHGNGDRIFGSAYSAFREAIVRAKIILPKGQLSHVLRHTFASHFVMNGGNILTLQRILGHSDLRMTMIYAHMAPEHLEEAVRLNPLALMSPMTVEPLKKTRGCNQCNPLFYWWPRSDLNRRPKDYEAKRI